MSSVWKKPCHSPRHQERNWLNLCWQSHDAFCDCNKPWLHLCYLINKDSPCRKPLPDIKNVLCLLTGNEEDSEEDTKENQDTGFYPGELDKLFDETNGENTATENTER